MKVLVTGASGFIGPHVIRELLKRNHEVIGTARSAEKIRNEFWFESIRFVTHDMSLVRSDEDLYIKFGAPDLLIHLAWQGLPNYKSLSHFEEVLPAQYSFLKSMVEGGLKNMLVTGTCYEYGMKSGSLKEDMIPDPANAYAIAKNSLRLFLEQLAQKTEFKIKWARLFYMYGEGQNPQSLIPQLQKAIDVGDNVFKMSGGMQVRDYLSVNQVADYLVTIALQNNFTGVINCCSGIPITVKEFVENYLEENNKQIVLELGHFPYLDYEPMEFWGDNHKLKQIVGLA